mmetsp:Transcript_40869/g.89433  ORF Transcript_40869/g.89433 Transcript_40869/m.89433 type:complete len:156 (-) Transcript_40869:667-1134(-)
MSQAAMMTAETPMDGAFGRKAVTGRAVKGDLMQGDFTDASSSQAQTGPKKSGAGKAKHRRGTKLKFCMFHLQGVCQFQSSVCDYAHTLEEVHEATRLQAAAKGPAERPLRPVRRTAHEAWLPLGEPLFLAVPSPQHTPVVAKAWALASNIGDALQ